MTRLGMLPTLDIRQLDQDAGAQAFLNAFDALTPGDSLHVLTLTEPVRLLERLQRERRGGSEGWACGHDPMGWHIDIRRGYPQPRGGVAELLEEEHHRLTTLCDQAFEAEAQGRHCEALESFGAFRHGLLRHIRVEEDLLFPVFEIRAGLPAAGPTATMRAEHRDIRLVLADLALALDQRRATAGALKRALDCLLSDHNRKEEAVLYPVLDRLLTPAESDTLAARFEALQDLNETRSEGRA
jgi:regulator of cell morphogenesis and NO signaling